MQNQFGKISKLHLEASLKEGKTILSDVSFTAPYKVMHPFYEKPGFMTVMQQTASAGVMAGDRQELDFTVHEGASMELLSQAYEKIHRMTDGHAERHIGIQVEKNASLFYKPLPVLPFGGSDFRNFTEIGLAEESSRFRYSEVLCCGRVAHGEKFQYNKYQNRICIRRAGRLIYLDNTRYDPSTWEMEGLGMYEGYTHLASLILCGIPHDEEWIRAVRVLLEETPDMEGGVTRIASGDIVVRILGRNAQKLMDLLDRM